MAKARCPHCKAFISCLAIKATATTVFLYGVDDKGFFDYYGELNKDVDVKNRGYLCPHCYKEITPDDDNAKDFLRGFCKVPL